jgi:lipid-A-disaccharide synthase
MRRTGIQQLRSVEDLAPLFEGGTSARHRELETTLIEVIWRLKPQVAVLVDYSVFHQRLSEALSLRGIPIVLYAAPNLASLCRRDRDLLRDRVEAVLGVFPAESASLGESGLNYQFVGSPLKDRTGKVMLRPETLGFKVSESYVAILPGSRAHDFLELAPFMIKICDILKSSRPELRFVMPVSSHIPLDVLAAVFKVPIETLEHFTSNDEGLSPRAHLRGIDLLRGMSLEIMGLARLALTSSGTTSLECALLGTPQVSVAPDRQRLGARQRGIFVGAVNQIAGQRLVPEYTPADDPFMVATRAEALLADQGERQKMQEEFHLLRDGLKGFAAENASVMIGEYLGSRRQQRWSP